MVLPASITLNVELSPLATPGHVLTLELEDLEANSAVANIRGEELRTYLISMPGYQVVDGMFHEWQNPREDVDQGTVENANVDITGYDTAGWPEETFFYLRVEGNILYGAPLPSTRVMATTNSGATGEGGSSNGEPISGTQDQAPLPVNTREDAIYIFLDNEDGGYEVPHLDFAADHMIEIKGENGAVLSSRYMSHQGSGGEWKWQYVKEVKAAAGTGELEAVVDEKPDRVYFHMVSWSGEDEDVTEVEELTPLDNPMARAYDSISLTDTSLSDWSGAFTASDTSPDGDSPAAHQDVTAFWLANDASYVYFRWDIAEAKATLEGGKGTYIAVDFDTDGTIPITQDKACFFEINNQGDITLEILELSTDAVKWTGTVSDYQLVSIDASNTGIEVRLPRTSDTGLTNDTLIGNVDVHVSSSHTSNVKDSVPDSTQTYQYLSFSAATATTDSGGDIIDSSGGVRLGIDPDDHATDAIDITAIGVDEDNDYFLITISCLANVDASSYSYAVFIDLDNDGNYEIAYNNYDSTNTYLYTWGANWGSGSSLGTGRFTASGTDITFKLDKDLAAEMNNDRDFKVMVAADIGGTDMLSDVANNDDNDPSAVGAAWEDFLDGGSGAGDGAPQPVPEFSNVLVSFLAFVLIMVPKRRQKGKILPELH